MTAIAYQDFIQDGTWAPGFGSSPLDIESVDNLVTPQLGDPWVAEHGFSDRILVRQFASTSTPVDIVGLLDIRYSHPLTVRVAHGPDTQIVPTTPILEYANSRFVVNMFWLLPSRIITNAIGFRFGSTTGAKYSIGRAWAGPLFVPHHGIKRNWKPKLFDGGWIKTSRGFQGFIRKHVMRRGVSLNFIHVPVEYAFGLPDNSIMDLQQLGFILGKTEPCIILARTHSANGSLNTHMIHRVGFYGHLQQELDIQDEGADNFSARLEGIELC